MGSYALAEAIADSKFVVTAECRPPRGADAARLRACAQAIGSSVHALSVPESEDGARLCSLAGCSVVAAAGADPILHLLTRDLNRIGLQATLLGAAAVGVRNVLCLSGRHQALTHSAAARGVFDIDPIQCRSGADTMRKEGRLANGQPLDASPAPLLGADTNPFADPLELHVRTLERAVAAGADFVITQPVFDFERFGIWMEQVRERGIDRRTCLIAGVMPFASAADAAEAAECWRGLDLPSEITDGLGAAADQRSAGIDLAAATARRLRETEGVSGIHLMGGKDVKVTAEVLAASGLARL